MSVHENEDELVMTYLKHRSAQKEEDFWAFQQILREARYDPELCWSRIQKLLLASRDESEISYVAAGPLEDLFNNFPDWTISQVTEEIGTNRRLAYALTQVWLQKDSPVHQQYDQLFEQYRLRERNPLTGDSWP